MSERMTGIHLPTQKEDGFRDDGWAEYGRKTRAEMIAAHRDHAERDLDRAQAILAAPDEAFHVETYVGVFARRNLEIIPPSAEPEEAKTNE